ncbi:Methyl-CpG DNA-binding [Sesbania bispinosa]|nr:Methyl-CpG DNA-binding [Sesbania bispinosa]
MRKAKVVAERPAKNTKADFDKVMPKLKNWRIESRQRNTTTHDAENKSGQRVMCDTYYHHPNSKRTLRSIPDVVNYILPESYDKIPKRIRFKNEKVTSTCSDSQNTEEEKNNAEEGNCSMEKSQSLPTEEGFTLHDVGALPFEELQEIIESLGVDDDSKVHFI